jgi:hypothetical protein
MSYPIEEQLKNLQEQVNAQEQDHYYSSPIEDTTFHGIITAIEDGCLKVSPLKPTLATDGSLTFPTMATATDKERVYVINVGVSELATYYKVNQIIIYFAMSGTGDDADKMRGTYVTYQSGFLPYPRPYLGIPTVINDMNDVAFVLPVFSGV